MPALIIILKVISVLLFGWRVYLLIRLKKLDSTMKYTFELFSMIEVAAGFAVALAGWLAVLDETTYAFTAGLNAVAIILTLTHNFRIIVAGDRMILIGMKIYTLKEIKGITAGRFSLNVFMKNGRKAVIPAPLTHNDTLRKMKYLK